MQRTETLDGIAGSSRTVYRRVALVSCFWCERRHPAEHALSVCSSCEARLCTMRALEMSGTYALSHEAIEGALTRTAPGNYALGYMDGGIFNVFYVGRSDRDLRRRLHEWVDMPSQYERYASTAKAPWGLGHRAPLPMGVPGFARVTSSESSYTHFAYSYAGSAEEAYAKEWRNYDAFGGCGGLDNGDEPATQAAS